MTKVNHVNEKKSNGINGNAMNVVKRIFNALVFFIRLENELSHIQNDINELKTEINELHKRINHVENRIDRLYEILIDVLDHVKK